jgi:3-oxoacyl-[acyl-carrier-protein] synthase-3
LEWHTITIPSGSYFTQHGQAVQRFAIKKMISMIKELIDNQSILPKEFYFIGHQANLRALQQVCKKMDIPAEKHLFNITEFGNSGASSAPSVLSENFHRFKMNDTVVMTLVGSGLTWGHVLIKFT